MFLPSEDVKLDSYGICLLFSPGNWQNAVISYIMGHPDFALH